MVVFAFQKGHLLGRSRYVVEAGEQQIFILQDNKSFAILLSPPRTVDHLVGCEVENTWRSKRRPSRLAGSTTIVFGGGYTVYCVRDGLMVSRPSAEVIYQARG